MYCNSVDITDEKKRFKFTELEKKIALAMMRLSLYQFPIPEEVS